MARRPPNSQEVWRESTRCRTTKLRSRASAFAGSHGTENVFALTYFGVVGYHPEMSARLLQSFSGVIDSTQFARAETGFPMPPLYRARIRRGNEDQRSPSSAQSRQQT